VGAPKKRIATELQIRDSIADVRDALRLRTPQMPNIWAFFSNKNDELLTIHGDLRFIQCVLLEGDVTVQRYELLDSPRDAIRVTRASGALEIYRCIYTKPTAAVDAKAQVLVSERDLAPRMTEFANWLLLSGAMTRARQFAASTETEILLRLIKQRGVTTIADALAQPNTDPALMLAAIGKGLAAGIFDCDTRGQLLHTRCEITLATKPREASSSKYAAVRQPTVKCVSAMPRNRRTNPHPQLFSLPERWLVLPCPELSGNDVFRRRCKAVQMYIHNAPYGEIHRDSGIDGSCVRKLFLRTLMTSEDGSPLGLRALQPYRHLKPYTRRSDLPPSNLASATRGGYAGALSALAARFSPGFLDLVEKGILQKRNHLASSNSGSDVARVTWVDLHAIVMSYLRQQGVRDDQYPFNTRDKAYSSLVALCNSILFDKPIRWIEARGGEDARRRTRIGNGSSSLICAQWVNQIVELDYQKEDSAAIVEIVGPKGNSIDVPVSRWWAGAIVEEYSQAVIATSDSFEAQTTEDCLMELVDVAVAPPASINRLSRFQECPDGRWLPSQLLPGLAGQAFDILKLDRAWAHKSTTALSAIVSTVGCAVCFGEPRAWYARDLVERTHEKLTQAGPQSLPATYGTGPSDTRKSSNPDEQARKWRLSQDDICDLIKTAAHWLNRTHNEGAHWAAPIEILAAAADGSGHRFFPRPLPRERSVDRPLMWHTIPCKICGDAKRGIVPFVRVNRTRFHGPQLAKSWNLVKRDAYLQVLRHDFRTARVLLAGSGEVIDSVVPEAKWRLIAVRWRDHNLIQKFGLMQKRHQRSLSPAHDFLWVKRSQIAAAPRYAKRPPDRKRDAAAVARIERNAGAHEEPLIDKAAPMVETPRAWGLGPSSVLGPGPKVGAIRRGSGHGGSR